MLDFLLVLGQIPGTNYHITFEQIVATVDTVLLLYILIRRPYIAKELIRDIRLFYLKTRYLYFRSRII